MKKILGIKPYWGLGILAGILLVAITFSVVQIAKSSPGTPDPGHDFNRVSGGIATGDLIYGSNTDVFSALADVVAGNALISGGVGVAPSWGNIGLTTHVSGILPTANGGTGIAYFTAAGPTAARVYTFPDAAATVLTSNAAVTVAQGGTGLSTLTTGNVILGAGTGNVTFVAPGTSGNVLTSDGSTWASAAAAGGNDPRIILDALTTGEQHDVTASTALTEVTALSQTLSAGTYTFRYYVIYRSNQLTEGIRLAVNYTGANGAFVWNWRWADLAATASTAVPDQDDVDVAGNVTGTFQSRAKSTTTRGVTLSVDTINADMFIIIEGVFVATGTGDLELWHGSETATAAYTTSVMIGTSVEIHKTK